MEISHSRRTMRRSLAAIAFLALLSATAGAARAVPTALPAVEHISPLWHSEGYEGDDLSPIVVEPNGSLHKIWAAYVSGSGYSAAGVEDDFPVSGALSVGFDSAGYGYVATAEAVKVYAPGALDGSAEPRPVRVVSGPSTRLDAATPLGLPGIVVAPNGSFMVQAGGTVRAQLVFPAEAHGDVRPRAYSYDRLHRSAVASAGGSSALLDIDGDDARVFSWSAGGKLALSRTIVIGVDGGWPGPQSVAMDNFGDLYVAMAYGNIEVFAPGASGSALPTSIYEPAYGALQVTVARNRAVYLVEPEPGDEYYTPKERYWTKYAALVPRAAATAKVAALSAPTSLKAGSVTASVAGSAVGGWLAGNVRFVLSAKGQATQMVTVALPNEGGGPRTSTVTAALPKLAKGAWTLQVAYGGNGDFAPAAVSRAITVK